MPTMDALELLTEDHERMKELLQSIDGTGDDDVDTREELFLEMRQELEMHEAIEEEIFYPALKDNPKTREITMEAYEEHGVVDVVLTEIEALPFDDETWSAKFSVMKENIEHHIEEEESEMFSQARKVFDKDMLRELGERMQGRKEELIAESGSQQGRGAA